MRYFPFAALILMLCATPFITATLELDRLQFDPAIIASGDRVDIVAQYHQSGSVTEQSHVGDASYAFAVSIVPDTVLSHEYILIEDATGVDQKGIITAGAYYNTRFRIKVADNAPAGDYGFKLVGEWLHNGVSAGASEYVRFTIPVKKQGIALSISNVLSTPDSVHSGDKNILLAATISNTGEKLAKNVRIKLVYPDGISGSYSNNNELGIGSIAAGSEQPVQLYVDTDNNLLQGVHRIRYILTYLDVNNNEYLEEGAFSFLVKKRPYLVVTESAGSGTAGEDISLRVMVKNIGEETADAVDVRLLKQSSQPFDMDVRTDYIGRLEPGASGAALFTLHATDDAAVKNHSFTLVLRANGDHGEGDDAVYTYTDAASLEITGKKTNRYPLYAVALLGLIAVIGIIIALRRAPQKRK